MTTTHIIGLCVAIPSLIALIILIYYICLKTLKFETEERKKKTKMYETITKYLEQKMKNENKAIN